MADVLNVIADILKQDKQQKREHARMMREVQKKLKEKEVEASEDNADFMGAVAQAAADGKKEFEFPPGSGKMYPVTLKDKDVGKKIAKKMDDKDEKEEEMDLGDRVKARMNSQKEDDEPEMDDDDDAGMSSDQLDKIADLVVQKLKDKAEDEMDDDEEPEATEAESGKETPVDIKPKMESISKNPHHRGMWAEALRKVYENTQIDEHCGECEESIEEKKGSDYELYHKTFSAAMQHAYAHAKKKGYTVDPDEIDNKVASGPRKPSSGKTNRYILGTDKKQKLHVQVANLDNKRYELNMYIEEVELEEGKGEFEVKYASSKRGPIKVSKFNTLDDAKKFLAQVKGEGMNGIISKGGKPVKEDEDLEKIVKELEKASQTHLGQSKRIKKHLDKMKEDVEQEIEEKADKKTKDRLKMFKKLRDKKASQGFQKTDLANEEIEESAELEEKKSDYEDQIKAFLAKGGKIQKGDRPNKRKIDKVTKGFLKKYGAMKKKEADLDAKDKEELEKMMDEAVVNETWIDNDAKKVQPKWKKMDKRAKKKWMDGIMAKAKKEGMPKDEVMDVLDDYGLVENFSENESLGVRFARKFYQKDKD